MGDHLDQQQQIGADPGAGLLGAIGGQHPAGGLIGAGNAAAGLPQGGHNAQAIAEAAANAALQAQVAAMAPGVEVLQHHQQAADEAGLGVPTQAQLQAFNVQMQDVSYECSSKQHLFFSRCFLQERIRDVLRPPASISWTPLTLVAAARASDCLTVQQTQKLQDMIIKPQLASQVETSSLKLKQDEPLTKDVVFRAFFEVAATCMEASNIPEVAEGPNMYQRTANAIFADSIRLMFTQQIRLERSMQLQLAEMSRAMSAQLHAATVSLKRDRQDKGDDTNKKRKIGNQQQKVCINWLKGTCKNPKCSDAHKGPLNKLMFLNERFCKGAVPQDRLISLADKETK
ncbi:unnamed protein product [Amoebophrya sp. A25]|nr:unnamed protein product [Amoebophrya sp. A25]|eukprot:GSA25T00027151001.1